VGSLAAGMPLAVSELASVVPELQEVVWPRAALSHHASGR